MNTKIKRTILICFLLPLEFEACNSAPHSHEKLCHVSVNMSLKTLEEAADAGQVALYEIQIRHQEGVRRQHELMTELQNVATNENLAVSEDNVYPYSISADVTVTISFSPRDGTTQRAEIIWYQDGSIGKIHSLNMWGERMWPTDKEKNYIRSLGFNLQEHPMSVDDILNAVRLWRASHL